MAKIVVASRTFDVADQQSFADLSGDFNPIHMDPIEARRTQAGAPIVHGSHASLWALDELVRSGHAMPPIAAIKVLFNNFIYLGDELALTILRDSATELRGAIVASGLVVSTIGIQWGPPATTSIQPLSDNPVSLGIPADLSLSEMHGRNGKLPPIAKSLGALFPFITAKLDERRVGSLALLSTLVGMVCPGLHSIFGDMTITIVDPATDDGLGFDVVSVDEVLRTVEMSVAGGGIRGSITAFVRHPPIEHQRLEQLASRVNGRPFEKTTALVIGGSRGLGALTARLLAAGGARVVITYAVGEADARKVELDISSARGPDVCRVLQYDARRDAEAQLAALSWEVNQLYYFATPRIFRHASRIYSASRLADFAEIYVSGFYSLCLALQARHPGHLAALYPSSVFVEDRPRGMTEYSMAKAAGEVLCNDMNRFVRGLSVTIRRLPRLLTDQTATVMPGEYDDPVDVLLPIVEHMHAATT